MTSDETMRSRTGRGWADWIRILDGWGAESRPHVEIARWLNQDQGVDGWWSQQITVGYELAIGRRVLGQRSDGRFTATATRTIGVPVEQLQETVTDDGLREQWLPRAPLRARASKADRTARFDWEDGSSRVAFWFEAAGDARARVVMEHERLPDAGTAAEMKAYWRTGLARLKELVEG